MRDPVQERLLDIIASKKKAARRTRAKPSVGKPGNVVDIMDALRKSLAGKAR